MIPARRDRHHTDDGDPVILLGEFKEILSDGSSIKKFLGGAVILEEYLESEEVLYTICEDILVNGKLWQSERLGIYTGKRRNDGSNHETVQKFVKTAHHLRLESV